MVPANFSGNFFQKDKKSIFVGIIHYLMYLCSRYRDLAQLVAHVVRDDEVAGSSPVIPTKQSYRLKIRKPMKFLKDFFISITMNGEHYS